MRFGISEIMRDVDSERTGRRGRPTSRRTRYRRQLIDGIRLDMVDEAQEMQRDVRNERRATMERAAAEERGVAKKKEAKKKSIRKLDRWFAESGQTNYLRHISDETYLLVYEQLQGTILAIGVQGLRSSCKRARAVRDLERATGLLRFGLLSDPTLRALGLDDLTQRKLQKSRQ